MYTPVTRFALYFRAGAARYWLCLAVLLAAFYPHVAQLQGGSATVRVDLATVESLARQRYGIDAAATVTEWGSLLRESVSLPTREQLLAANNFFNQRLRWTPDINTWGIEDYWATPLETMGRREGDCEDFSIAKYITLLALGVAPESLRLVYVKARLASGASQAHMVLAWYESPRSPPLILDNINPLILGADKRQDLQPVFSFNARELWLRGGSTRTDASPRARLSRWHQVLERVAAEGVSANW